MGVQKNINGADSKRTQFYRRILRMRKERERRRHRRMLACALAMAAMTCGIFLGICCASFRSSANAGFKYYTQVTVESGDTLWSLADSYIDYGHYRDKSRYVAEVQRINRLDEECRILAGQVLIVPYYSEAYVE